MTNGISYFCCSSVNLRGRSCSALQQFPSQQADTYAVGCDILDFQQISEFVKFKLKDNNLFPANWKAASWFTVCFSHVVLADEGPPQWEKVSRVDTPVNPHDSGLSTKYKLTSPPQKSIFFSKLTLCLSTGLNHQNWNPKLQIMSKVLGLG